MPNSRPFPHKIFDISGPLTLLLVQNSGTYLISLYLFYVKFATVVSKLCSKVWSPFWATLGFVDLLQWFTLDLGFQPPTNKLFLQLSHLLCFWDTILTYILKAFFHISLSDLFHLYSRFWWLPCFPAKNHPPQTLLSFRVYLKIEWLSFFSQNQRFFQKKSCIGSLFCYRRYSILLLRVSPIDCVFCFLPSSYSSRCRMLRTRLLSINMTSVNGLNKAEPFDSLRFDVAGILFSQFIRLTRWQKGVESHDLF